MAPTSEEVRNCFSSLPLICSLSEECIFCYKTAFVFQILLFEIFVFHFLKSARYSSS